jgi:hypothetical protein
MRAAHPPVDEELHCIDIRVSEEKHGHWPVNIAAACALREEILIEEQIFSYPYQC